MIHYFLDSFVKHEYNQFSMIIDRVMWFIVTYIIKSLETNLAT